MKIIQNLLMVVLSTVTVHYSDYAERSTLANMLIMSLSFHLVQLYANPNGSQCFNIEKYAFQCIV